MGILLAQAVSFSLCIIAYAAKQRQADRRLRAAINDCRESANAAPTAALSH
jgi:hypothetical protein